MNNRSKDEAANQKNRIIFAQHGDSRGGTRSGRPTRMAGLERAQKAIGGEWPDREENRIGIEAVGMKLIGRQQHQKEEHNYSLVTLHEATRNQVNRPQRYRRISHCQKLER